MSVPITNGIWSALQRHFEYALRGEHGASGTADLDDGLYTTRRLHENSSAQVKTVLSRLPKDLQQLPEAEVGPLEAELLDFLFNALDHRLLTLVGLRGVGKTSLLLHVFRHLRNRCPSLQSFLPIILDLRAVTKVPTELDILVGLAEAASRVLPDTEYVDLLRAAFQGDVDLVNARQRDEARFLFRQLSQHIISRAKAAGQQPVFIFDNCDQLTYGAVTTVMDLARTLNLRDNTTVLLTLRPFVFRNQIEREYDRGAFFTRSLAVTPPDLVYLLSRRLRAAFKADLQRAPHVLLRQGYSIPIDVGGANRILTRILKYFFQARAQDVLVECLTNNDIRRALLAVERFLKSRQLDIYRLLQLPAPAASYPVSNRRHTSALLAGVMTGEYRYYREALPDGHNIVMDMFYWGERAYGREYTLQYRLLTLLSWRSTEVGWFWCQHTMEQLGYRPDAISRAGERLLKFGLLVSPEHESSIGQARTVRISHTGRFYLNSLCSDPDYLYHVIFDVPLTHRTWTGNDNSDCLERIDSLLELLHRVAEAELVEVCEMPEALHLWLPRRMLDYGLLGRRILETINIIIDEAAERIDASMATALADHRSTLRDLDAIVSRAERTLLEMAKSEKRDEAPELVYEFALGDGGDLTIKAPARVDWGLTRVLRLEVTSPRYSDEQLGAVCELLDGDTEIACSTSYATLIPEGKHHVGEFLISLAKQRRKCVELRARAWVIKDGVVLGCGRIPA